MTHLLSVQLPVLCDGLRHLGGRFCLGLQCTVQARVPMADLVVLEELSRLISLPGNGRLILVTENGSLVRCDVVS